MTLNWNAELRWDPKRGLRVQHYADPVALGTYQRLRGSDKWRVRVRRRGAGFTWSRVSNDNQVIKRIRMEALLLGLQV